MLFPARKIDSSTNWLESSCFKIKVDEKAVFFIPNSWPMNEKSIECLLTVYRLSQPNFGMGADTRLVNKLVGATRKELDEILLELKTNSYITEKSTTVSLTQDAFIFLQKYITHNRVVILEISAPTYAPRINSTQTGYRYNYYVSEGGKVIRDGTITVLVTDVLAITWKLDFAEAASNFAQKVLLFYAVSTLKLAIRDGSLRPSLTVELNSRNSTRDINFAPDDLLDIKDAQFVVLNPQLKPSLDNTVVTAPRLPDGKELKYNRELSWYYDENNIPNQRLVTTTVNFLVDHKSEIVAPLDFLNLLIKQVDLLRQFLNKPEEYLTHLKQLPISPELLYTLLGMLLKWHGGYPVNNLNEDYNAILLLVEDEFIRMHPERDTTDAEFCRAEENLQKKMRGLQNLLTNIGQRIYDGGLAMDNMGQAGEAVSAPPADNIIPAQEDDLGYGLDVPIEYQVFSEGEPVMGVKELARNFAHILASMKNEKGQMVGIFGRWGRGKTYFITQLKTFLKEWRQPHFIEVEYHAWKYQETPASWAYLYEQFLDKYLGKGIWYPFRLFWLNCRRHGLLPILTLLLTVVASVGISWGLWMLKEQNKEKPIEWLILGAIPVTLVAAITYIGKLYKQISPKAIDLIKRYSLRNSFKSSLGIQAEIQEELIKLLKVWIPEKYCQDSVEPSKWWQKFRAWLCLKLGVERQNKRIVLFVEDIDRCSEDRIIQSIDALRVLLEDGDVAKRVLIVTAIDERILKNAVLIKYDKVVQTAIKYKTIEDEEVTFRMITEYLDKLFISAIKLGELTTSDIKQYLMVLMKQDLAQSLPSKTFQEPTTVPAMNPVDTLSQTLRSAAPSDLTSQEEETVVPIGRQQQHANQPAVNENLRRKTTLSESEFRCFDQLSDEWMDLTPRKLRIFYFRYQLCRNLLATKYKQIDRKNIWGTEKGILIVMKLIQYFSSPNKLASLANVRKQIVSQKNQFTDVPFINSDTKVDRQDIVMLLEIIEIGIAY